MFQTGGNADGSGCADATSSAHLEDLAYLDEQRHAPMRTSPRMAAARSGQDLRASTNIHAGQSQSLDVS
ncbi:hypothetical protein AALO_G00281720 [Alosa alosa]|uniref:Uncharacterized protein n=1 Tax=Alosa alosa TaxID=278164 RepID=A0AAV6FJZ1_9TELE|nr:hypothetical protein AALO_G00281720 [Alosa alosa]